MTTWKEYLCGAAKAVRFQNLVRLKPCFEWSALSETSALCIPCYAHHGRSQQPVFQLIAALQLVDDVIVFGLIGVDHLDRLMQIRVEDLTLSRHGLDTQLCQRIMKLLVNQLDAVMEILQRR